MHFVKDICLPNFFRFPDKFTISGVPFGSLGLTAPGSTRYEPTVVTPQVHTEASQVPELARLSLVFIQS